MSSVLTHVSGIWSIDIADMYPSADVRIAHWWPPRGGSTVVDVVM